MGAREQCEQLLAVKFFAGEEVAWQARENKPAAPFAARYLLQRRQIAAACSATLIKLFAAAAPNPEAAYREYRPFTERSTLRQDAKLDRRIVGIEEGADAPELLARRIKLAVENGVDGDHFVGGGNPRKRRAVNTADQQRNGDVTTIAEALAGALDFGVGEGSPELRGAISQRVRAIERLGAGRVCPVQVDCANFAEGSTAALGPSALEGVEKVVHRDSA